ncbi:MAG: hypothetical protein AAF828_07470 [Bacteroidota bacterium]
MKKQLLLLLIVVLGGTLSAQEATKHSKVTLGYWGHFAIQPGVKVGYLTDLSSWNSQHDQLVQKSWFINPQLGVYAWPQKHTNYVVNIEAGLMRRSQPMHKFSAFSFGLGYLTQSRITSVVVNLSDGEQDKVRENQAWLLTTANYSFGRSLGEKLGWYSKISMGMQFGPIESSSLVGFLELGLTYGL